MAFVVWADLVSVVAHNSELLENIGAVPVGYNFALLENIGSEIQVVVAPDTFEVADSVAVLIAGFVACTHAKDCPNVV